MCLPLSSVAALRLGELAVDQLIILVGATAAALLCSALLCSVLDYETVIIFFCQLGSLSVYAIGHLSQRTDDLAPGAKTEAETSKTANSRCNTNQSKTPTQQPSVLNLQNCSPVLGTKHSQSK